MQSNLRGLTVMALIMAAPVWGQAQQKTDNCSAAVTQLEINRCADVDASKAEGEMNQALDALLSKYKEDAVFVERMKKAQRLWLEFRDAELAAQFPTAPEESPQFRYGSMYPMCYSNARAALTRQRAQQLKELLKSGTGC